MGGVARRAKAVLGWLSRHQRQIVFPRHKSTGPAAHQTVDAKALRKWRTSRSVTWRPAARNASPVMAIITVANLLQAGVAVVKHDF